MLFGVNTLGGPRNIVLDGGFDPPTARGRGDRCSLYLLPAASCYYRYFMLISVMQACYQVTQARRWLGWNLAAAVALTAQSHNIFSHQTVHTHSSTIPPWLLATNTSTILPVPWRHRRTTRTLPLWQPTGCLAMLMPLPGQLLLRLEHILRCRSQVWTNIFSVFLQYFDVFWTIGAASGL